MVLVLGMKPCQGMVLVSHLVLVSDMKLCQGIGLLPSIGICICALVENFKQFHNIRKDLETFATKPNYESMKKEAILKGV